MSQHHVYKPGYWILLPPQISRIICKAFVILDIYCSVHRNFLWNNQQMSQCEVKFYFSASPLYMFRAAHAHHQEYNLNCINSHWYNS